MKDGVEGDVTSPTRAEQPEEAAVLRISRQHLRLKPPRLVFLKKRGQSATRKASERD